jgi:phage gpG-like protein
MITITLDTKRVETMLKGVTDGLNDLRPAWPKVDEIVRAFMKQVFVSEGAYGGRKWVALNQAYAAKKRRRWGARPILQASGQLFGSFTARNHPDHVYRVGPTFGEFGSRRLYAKAHQYGIPARSLPARPIIRKFTKAEGERVVDAILAHLFKSARGRR